MNILNKTLVIIISAITIATCSHFSVSASAPDNTWNLYYYPGAPTNVNQISVVSRAYCSKDGIIKAKRTDNYNNSTVKFEIYSVIIDVNANTSYLARMDDGEDYQLSDYGIITINGNFTNELDYTAYARFTALSYPNTRIAYGIYK